MELLVYWNSKVSAQFPELAICVGIINKVKIEKENEQLKKLKQVVYTEVRKKYKIETLKDDTIVRAYRDFYWKLGIDPTKIRPSGEALLRRFLHGDELPNISNVVDAYNLASMKTVIPISGFDKDRVNPPFNVRFANNGETFMGIGMDKPIILTDKMLVLADQKQVLCIYPYRDANYTKISENTRNVLIVGYGAMGISEEQLTDAVRTTLEYVKMVSNGEIEMIKVFSSTPK